MTLTALMPRGRSRVLAALLLHPERDLYLREIASRAGVSLSSVQHEVARLTDAGILIRTRRGRQTFYRANTRSPLFPDLRAILLKTIGLADLLREVLADPRIRLALVYGSLASGHEREGSDIDVLIVGDVGPREVSDRLGSVEQEVGREVNAVVLTPDEYRNRVQSGDTFLQGVMVGPKLYALGDDDEAERLAQ
jgi:DNA-binding transcriptional ArsR family regulator